MTNRGRRRDSRGLPGSGAALRANPASPSVEAQRDALQQLLARDIARGEVSQSLAARQMPSGLSQFDDAHVREIYEALLSLRVGSLRLIDFIDARVRASKKKRGRPSILSSTAVLVAAFLCASDGRAVSGTEIGRAVFRRMSSASRRLLGVQNPTPTSALASSTAPTALRLRTERRETRAAQRAIRRFVDAFDPSPYPRGVERTWTEVDRLKRAVSEEQQEENRQALDLVASALLGLPWLYVPEANRARYGSACIDGTPIPLYSRGRGVHDTRASTDPDGGMYVRTGNHDGEQHITKAAFAIEAHLVVAADINDERQYLPGLPLSMSTARPGVDPAGAARRALTVLETLGHKPAYLAGDNLYTLAAHTEFQTPARTMGWDLVLGYPTGHDGVQGSSSGATLIEGHWYCPAIPAALASANQDLRAGTIPTGVHSQRITERASYALRAKEKAKPGSPQRWMCPAAGANPTAKCAMKPNSEQERRTTLINGARIDLRPRITPDADTAAIPPIVCRQDTITVQPEEGAKYRQPLGFGTPEHTRIYNLLRQNQEGFHGTAKDHAHEALASPGRRRIRGIAANTIIAAILFSSAGLRRTRAFLAKAIPDEQGTLYVPRKPRQPGTGPPGAPPVA